MLSTVQMRAICHVKLAGKESRCWDITALIVRAADVESVFDLDSLLHPFMLESVHATHYSVCPDLGVSDSGATDYEGFQLGSFRVDSIQVYLPGADVVDSSTAIELV
jgi:hypothetical protein